MKNRDTSQFRNKRRVFFLWGMLLALGVFLQSVPARADVLDDVTPSGFGVTIGAWISPTVSGSINAGGIGSTSMSFKNDLGIPSQTMIVPEVYYRWDHGQILDVRYNQFNQTSTQTLANSQSFQGSSFPAGIATTANAKVQWADIVYELPIQYDQFPPHDRFLNIFLDLQPVRAQFNLTNASGASGSQTITLPLPLPGVHGKYRIGPDTSLEFRAAGIYVGFVDSLAWDYNLEAGINEKILNDFTLSAKYRYFTFHNRDASANVFDFSLYGPEVDLNFQF